MRISDWSSDVCSSDLRLVESVGEARQHRAAEAGRRPRREQHGGGRVGMRLAHRLMLAGVAADARRVSDRDEGFDMAGLAILGQVGVLARKRPRQPGLVGVIALRQFIYAAIAVPRPDRPDRSAEHTSVRKSLMLNSYAVFCLKTKT